MRWCGNWGVPLQDTDDIVQEALLAVFLHMPEFERQRRGAFRSWMKVITLRAWHSQLRRRMRTVEPSRLSDLQESNLFGQILPSNIDLLKLLDRIADEEILELAILRVRQKVSDQVWDIFESVEIRDIPIAIVAELRGLTSTAVRVSNFRVRKLLREFVERFEGP